MPENAIGERFDLIVMSETIEHLYTSPSIIFAFLSKLLNDIPGSGILIQTPNAVNIYKRIKLALGRIPYELIERIGQIRAISGSTQWLNYFITDNLQDLPLAYTNTVIIGISKNH